MTYGLPSDDWRQGRRRGEVRWPRPRRSPTPPLIAGIYGIFPTADGWIAVVGVVPTDRPRFYATIGRPEINDDPRFKPLLVFGEVKQALRSTGRPLGVDGAGDFPMGPVVRLEPGDLVFLLSDGIVEARNGDGPQFGIGRALKVVQARRHEPPADIVAALVQEVRAWSQGVPADDMTAIILKTGG